MITEQQKEERKRFLGSSDAAAVLGLDSYRSPYDVYLEKTGKIQPTGREQNNDAIEIGNYLESGIIDWFADKKKIKVVKSQRFVHANGIMAANLDAIIEGDGTEIVEAKTHAVVSRYINEEWGQVETSEVPERIQLQCHHQMAVVPQVKVVWIPVLLGGVGLRHYRIDRNEELLKHLVEMEEMFWYDHVVKDIPPEDSTPSLETLKKIKREPNKTIAIADAIVLDWLAAKQKVKEAEAIKEEKEILLLSTMGDAEAAEFSGGTITYLMGKPRASYTVPEGPGYRQLRHVKPKGEKKNGK